jgi:DNA-binding transcriptional LysR family regulator
MNEMNWDDLRLFIAVAQARGLSGAATVTGLSAPTLGRRMLALENSLGRELFVRHAKGYDLTTQGDELLASAAGLSGQIDVMTAAHSHRLVKISAGTWTTRLLCQHAKTLAQDNVTLRFVGADHVLDIPHREAVIGIRNRRPDHIGLAGQRVAAVTFARYGAENMPWVQVVSDTPSARWVKNNAPRDTIEVTHPTHALDLARAGAAQAVLPTFIGDTEPDLPRLCKNIADLSHDQWIVSHNTDRFIAEVRVTIDRLVGVLKP